jgi:glyoxylase-like metal-dependent hydrolase (beta-lactamase superfamily II)
LTDRLTIGDAQIVSVPDGAGVLPPVSGVPWAAYRDVYREAFRPDGSWHIHNNCYIVSVDRRLILVDTGMGPWPYKRYGSVEGRLMASFVAAGLAPTDIDIVFLTHGHPDHVGWNVLESGELTFPNARYLLHEKDWQEFTGRDKTPNYVRRSLLPVEAAGRLDLLDGETTISDSLTAIDSPGHTPGHMSLLLYSGGEGTMFSGDVFSHPAYITDPDMEFPSDTDTEQGKRTRHAMLGRIQDEGLTVVVDHFKDPGWGKVVRVEGRRIFRAL